MFIERNFTTAIRVFLPFLLCLELQRHLPISVILILMNLMFQAFIATGFNLILTFDPTPAFNPAHRHVDYEKEPGKVRTELVEQISPSSKLIESYNPYQLSKRQQII